MGAHDGHRGRVRERFLKNGLDGFADHEVLELLLFYAIPVRDVNPLAHRLLDTFGSLAGVLDAPAAELARVEGSGETTAALLTLIPQLARRYAISGQSFEGAVRSSEDAGRVMLPYFVGETREAVYVACLDGKRRVIGCRLMGRGGNTGAGLNVRQVVEYAVDARAAAVIVAHNHPSGVAVPSGEDREATEELARALRLVDVELTDHLVVADGDFVSMRDAGMMESAGEDR